MFMKRHLLLATATLAAAGLIGCGSSDNETTTSTDSAQTSSTAVTAKASEANGEHTLDGIKTYLVDHTKRLTEATNDLQEKAQDYYDLAKTHNLDYTALLKQDAQKVSELVGQMKQTWRAANPAYEEAEGVVAGVSSLASYDVILDAGGDESAGEDAVPFDLTLQDGRVFKKPGNFFAITETSLWGTEKKFAAKGVKADLNGDGKVSFGESVPDADFLLAAASEMNRYAKELDGKANAWVPTKQDAFNAVVVMTPTMSEYFEAWKNSRFIAGKKATEKGFVGTSRLSDIADILSGLVVVYDGIESDIEAKQPKRAEQIEENLKGLLKFVEKVRDREKKGTKFTAAQADAFGTEAQSRAESIAGQVTQAAAALKIKIDS